MMQDLSGTRLGQYELRSRLGRGGMAEVYKAYQPGMDRYVAIKVMLGHLANDEDFVERFRREAQAVGRLRHPHIVQVFDFGVTDDVYYMAMEFIEGETLKSHIIKQKSLSPDEAIRITIQLADALEYAHSAGMIHRDLKPANIMFMDQANTHSILTDFGIARILGQAGLTASGAMVGTPAYISPEAARGESTDARADLYGLGVILYEMLTGKVPYDADTPLAIVLKHINAPLPTLQEYGDKIPEVIERVILKSLTKNPEDRYQTAGEMKAALEQTLVDLQATAPTRVSSSAQSKTASVPDTTASTHDLLDEPTQQLTTPAKPTTQTAKPRSRKRLYIGIGVFILILFVLAIAAGGKKRQEEADMTATAVAVIVTESEQQATEESTNEPSIAPSEATSDAPTSQPTDVSTDVPTDSPTDPPTTAPTLIAQQLPQSEISLIRDISPIGNRVDEMFLAGAEDAVSDLLQTLVTENPNDVDALIARSLWLSGQGEGGVALESAQTAFELQPENPMALAALSDARLALDDPERATQVISLAYEMEPANPQILWRLSRIQRDVLGDYPAAMNTLAAAHEHGASGYDFAEYAGELLYDMERYEEALPYLQAQLNTVLDSDFTRLYVMGSLIQTGQEDQAFEMAQQSAQGVSDPFYLGNLAYVAYRSGNIDQARQWADTARALSADAKQATYVLALITGFIDNNAPESVALFESLGDDWFETWPMLTPEFGHDRRRDVAQVLAHNGLTDNALAAYNAMLEENPSWVDAYLERAEIHASLDQPDLAQNDLRSAYENIDARNDQPVALFIQGQIYSLFWDEAYPNMLPEISSRITEDQLSIPPISDISPIHNEVERLLMNGDEDAAIELTTRELEAEPGNSAILSARVYAWLYVGNAGEALADANTAIEVDPENVMGYLALIDAAMHWSVDDPELAITTMQQLREKEGIFTNPHVVWRAAVLQRIADNNEQARETFNLAIELDAQGLDYAWALGSFWLDEAESPQEIEQALEPLKTVFVSGDDLYRQTRYIQALIYAGQNQEAHNAAAQLAPDVMGEPYYYDMLALAAFRAGNPEQARAWARMKIALMLDDANDARYIDGLISWQLDGDAETALRSIVDAIENRNESEFVLFNRWLGTNAWLDASTLLVELGRYDNAMERYNTFIERFGDYAPAYEARADLFLIMEDVEAARADLQRALDLTENPDERQRLVDRLVELGPVGSDG